MRNLEHLEHLERSRETIHAIAQLESAARVGTRAAMSRQTRRESRAARLGRESRRARVQDTAAQPTFANGRSSDVWNDYEDEYSVTLCVFILTAFGLQLLFVVLVLRIS